MLCISAYCRLVAEGRELLEGSDFIVWVHKHTLFTKGALWLWVWLRNVRSFIIEQRRLHCFQRRAISTCVEEQNLSDWESRETHGSVWGILNNLASHTQWGYMQEAYSRRMLCLYTAVGVSLFWLVRCSSSVVKQITGFLTWLRQYRAELYYPSALASHMTRSHASLIPVSCFS